MSRRRFTGRIAAGLLAAGVLVACGSPGSSSSDTPAPNGSASESGAATGEPIKVGIVTSLSGPLQSYGQMYLDAFEVCLEDVANSDRLESGNFHGIPEIPPAHGAHADKAHRNAVIRAAHATGKQIRRQSCGARGLQKVPARV